MRLGNVALTLVLGFGIVGLASAQESRSWFSRMFTPADKTDAAKKIDAKADEPKAPSASTRRLEKAKADLDRRQEICLKVREVAIATGDEDLRRKAEQLDQRAWDLFLAIKNRVQASERPLGEMSAKDLGLTKGGSK